MLDSKLRDLRENTLKTLDLSGDEIGDAGATALADALRVNKSLETLDLDDNHIGDAGATALADALLVNETLETLFLTRNEIRDAGATALADTLLVNETLKNLFLDDNYIGEAGATALAGALHVNKSLKTLYLSGNYIGDAGATALREAIEFRDDSDRRVRNVHGRVNGKENRTTDFLFGTGMGFGIEAKKYLTGPEARALAATCDAAYSTRFVNKFPLNVYTDYGQMMSYYPPKFNKKRSKSIKKSAKRSKSIKKSKSTKKYKPK